jgi:hypothetical protein
MIEFPFIGLDRSLKRSMIEWVVEHAEGYEFITSASLMITFGVNLTEEDATMFRLRFGL